MRRVPELQFVGGEQDGHTVTVSTINHCPEYFYAVPLADLEKIRAAPDVFQRLVIREKLAILAYRFERILITNRTISLRYVRHPEMDDRRNEWR